MDKIFQRTKYAQLSAARRLERSKKALSREEKWQNRQTNIRVNRATSQTVRNARQNRRIDWDAGLIAPRRETGEQAETFGASEAYQILRADAEPEKRPRWISVAVGDRVVITKGRDKGRIGTVSNFSDDGWGVKITSLNEADIHVPKWMRQEEGIAQVAPIPLTVLFEDVKLVYPLPDPESGVYRDVIIDRLTCVNRKFNKITRKWDEGDRVIAGTNTIIRWPAKNDPQEKENEVDTLRMAHDETTFKHCLIYPPMPLSVIDELRNKYSKFRTRHDHDFVAKRDAEAARTQDRKNLIKSMQTPLQQLAELRLKEKKTPELTTDQLAKIGEVIAQERVKATNNVRAQ